MARARVVLPVFVWLVSDYEDWDGDGNGYRSLECQRWLRGIGSPAGALRPCLPRSVSCALAL